MYIKTLVLISSLFPSDNMMANTSYSVTDFGAIPNDSIDDSSAFNHALSLLPDHANLTIPSGEYTICNTLFLTDKNNVSIFGSYGAILKKCPEFNSEYLLYIKNTDYLKVSNLHFVGLFNGGQTANWGKQGVYLASTKNSVIANNRFEQFGDAALRITTRPTRDAIESRDALIINNHFSNCAQVTTTQAQATEGFSVPSTHNIIFASNQFDNCTLKLSARKATQKAVVFNNHFKNISSTALESSYYNDVTISHNQFDNNTGFAINVYPNSRAQHQVKWGDINITNNTFNNSDLGIRLQSFSSTEVAENPIQNLSITQNIFRKMSCVGTDNDKYKKLIRTYSQNATLSFENVLISENRFDIDQGCDFLSLDARDRNVLIEENISVSTHEKKQSPIL